MSTASGTTTNPQQMIMALQQQIEQLTEQIRDGGIGRGQEGTAVVPKFPKPDSYDGAKGDVQTFLTQAKAYLRVNTAITDEVFKILCIDNLVTGKAMEWWEPTLRDYLDNEDPGDQDEETRDVFRDYENFEKSSKEPSAQTSQQAVSYQSVLITD